jgi:hypothetical protein
MFQSRRKQLFIDGLQTVIMVRVVAYWLFCLLASALMACCWIAWLCFHFFCGSTVQFS